MYRSFVPRIALIAALLAALPAGSHSAAADEVLTLTADGRPRATIVLAEKPTGAAQLAAFELQHYLKKLSGAELPIVREPLPVDGTRILVGESGATRALGYDSAGLKLGTQEYVAKTLPGALVLLGYDTPHFPEQVLYHGDSYASYRSIYHDVCVPQGAHGRVGTCYAVYDFLENVLGVRWYYPNEELGEVVEPRATIAVRELDVRRSPSAPIRSIHPHLANTEKLYFIDTDEPQKFQSSWINTRTSLLYWVRHRCFGGEAYNASHSFHGYDKAFGESHPEWFSTKSFERMKQLNFQNQVNPCLTAPGLFETVLQTGRDYLDAKPEPFPWAYYPHRGSYFTFGLNDNTNMCGCEDCRALYRHDLSPEGNASHYVWGFVNRLAREVRKSHPDSGVSCLAYFNYTTPPEGLVLEPNVAVTFCKYYQSYTDKSYQERDYQRISDFMVNDKAGMFTTWEYMCKPFISDWPFPCLLPHVQADDVRRLSQIPGFHGGRLEFAYATTYSGAKPGGYAWTNPVLDFMNLYWRVKLYDDFEFDIEKGLDEYHASFFGPGGPGMNKFHTAMEERWMKLGGGGESRSWWNKLGTREFLAELSGYVAEARDATEEGSLYRRRVELIDAGILQYMLKARARFERATMGESAPISTAAVARAQIRDGQDWADDRTWADAMEQVIHKTANNEPAAQSTRFRLAYDDQQLYIKARMSEPLVSKMKASVQDHDIGGFNDDSLELFLDPEGQGKQFFHFCINSRKAVYDAAVDPFAIGAKEIVTWNSSIQVKSATGDDYWELRLAVPFAELGMAAPKAGATWRFNLGRNRQTEPGQTPNSAWSPTLGEFGKPERFGVITFNGPDDRGRVPWSCDFDSPAFASESGESPLIGLDGWYENSSYANRGWDKSWKVVRQGQNRLAVCDVNATNPSTIVPMHAVQVSPGVVAVEVDYRRLNPAGGQPLIMVSDSDGRYLLYLYISNGRQDGVGYYLRGGATESFYGEQHSLGNFSAPGHWFAARVEINTVAKRVDYFLRGASGSWTKLNKEPLPYYMSDVDAPSTLFLGLGTRRTSKELLPNNLLEMDNVRVTQLSVAE